MVQTRTAPGAQSSVSDAAVTGLLHGVVAGGAMAIAMLITGVLTSTSPADLFISFGPAGGSSSPLVGALSHLAVSAIYGMVFALIWRSISWRSNSPALALICGLIYAGSLYLVAMLVLLPSVQSPMLGVPVPFAVGHLVYGLALGLLAKRA